MSDIEAIVNMIDDLQTVRSKATCLNDRALTLDLWERLDKLIHHVREIKRELIDREIGMTCPDCIEKEVKK